ncbi:MAG: hypothetical protein ACRDTT_23980, partial [Pseudonocardiaceae bacterium]
GKADEPGETTITPGTRREESLAVASGVPARVGKSAPAGRPRKSPVGKGVRPSGKAAKPAGKKQR